MVKMGIIGNVAAMQQYVQAVKREAGFEMVGKASVGLMDQPAASLLSVPEFSKADLFREADAIIIDKASMVNYQILKDAVRSYKHLFIADIPEINPAQCLDLHKLVLEAGNVVSVRNPLQEDPAARWITDHWHEPGYLNYFEGYNAATNKRSLLIKILLLAHSLFNTNPQKIRVSGFTGLQYSFLNIRLDYSTFSAVNVELLSQPENETRFKAALPGKYAETTGPDKLFVNHTKTALDPAVKSGFDLFLEQVRKQQPAAMNNLHTLHQVLETYEELLRKIRLYSNWQI